MTKRELIDAIHSINPTATREFLSEFSERDLADYIRQLGSIGAASMDAQGHEREIVFD